jgi:hypothetical protein
MKTPQSWIDISVSQFVELQSLKAEGFYDYQLEKLALLADVPPEDFDDYTIDELSEYQKQFSWSNKEPHNNYSKQIGEYTFKGLNTLTLGEYIDIDTYLSAGVFENLTTYTAIVYRKTKVNKWGVVEFEPYKYDIFERAKEFEHIPITSVYGLLNEWAKHKENVLDVYSTILDTSISEDEIAEAHEEDKEELQKEKDVQGFGWERLLYNLADGDITKIDNLLNLPFVFVMNMVSMKNALKI